MIVDHLADDVEEYRVRRALGELRLINRAVASVATALLFSTIAFRVNSSNLVTLTALSKRPGIAGNVRRVIISALRDGYAEDMWAWNETANTETYGIDLLDLHANNSEHLQTRRVTEGRATKQRKTLKEAFSRFDKLDTIQLSLDNPWIGAKHLTYLLAGSMSKCDYVYDAFYASTLVSDALYANRHRIKAFSITKDFANDDNRRSYPSLPSFRQAGLSEMDFRALFPKTFDNPKIAISNANIIDVSALECLEMRCDVTEETSQGDMINAGSRLRDSISAAPNLGILKLGWTNCDEDKAGAFLDHFLGIHIKNLRILELTSFTLFLGTFLDFLTKHCKTLEEVVLMEGRGHLERRWPRRVYNRMDTPWMLIDQLNRLSWPKLRSFVIESFWGIKDIAPAFRDEPRAPFGPPPTRLKALYVRDAHDLHLWRQSVANGHPEASV